MLRIGLALLILLALSGPAGAAPGVLDSQFVLFRGGTVTESDKVPLVPDEVCFEWRLKLDLPDGLVKFTEVFTLPTPPAIWETNPGAENGVSENRKTSTTTDVDRLVGGWLHHGWCVAEGDPLGTYQMEISVDGTLLHTFVFKLIEPGTLYL